MTILGQQALLDEEAPDRYLACRTCGTDFEEEGLKELADLKGCSNSGIATRAKDGELIFMSNGYTDVNYDGYTATGYLCIDCGAMSKTLDEIAEWRVREDG